MPLSGFAPMSNSKITGVEKSDKAHCSIVLLLLCSCEFRQQCYYRKWKIKPLSLSLIVRLSCQFNRVSFINVYWIILNDRLSFWLFNFFMDPYHMTKCTQQGRVWLPNFCTMCWVICRIQCHMTLYTVHHMIPYNTSYSTTVLQLSHDDLYGIVQ